MADTINVLTSRLFASIRAARRVRAMADQRTADLYAAAERVLAAHGDEYDMDDLHRACIAFDPSISARIALAPPKPKGGAK